MGLKCEFPNLVSLAFETERSIEKKLSSIYIYETLDSRLKPVLRLRTVTADLGHHSTNAA